MKHGNRLSLAAIQQEYSLVSRGIERDLLPALRELGVGVPAYGVLSRGLLSGRVTTQTYAGKPDFRAHAPRFQGENLKRNLKLVEALKTLARKRAVTPVQLAIAWALSRGDDIIPLIGARTRERLAESLRALSITLTQDELDAIEQAVPYDAVAGERYDDQGMAMLDSERETD